MSKGHPRDMPTRKALRLKFFDYAASGAYFVTVCVHERRRLLSRISDGRVVLNTAGEIVGQQLRSLPARLDGVDVDPFVIMPNHLHAVVRLAPRARQASPLLGQVVGAFKSGSAREINRLRRTPGARVWQRGYYEHVIRDESDLERACEYIANNPARWFEDPENV